MLDPNGLRQPEGSRDRGVDACYLEQSMRWELCPRVEGHERTKQWHEMEELLRRAPKTVEAYGRSLNDYLRFCGRKEIDPEGAGRGEVALYVGDLASRPNPRGKNVLDIGSGVRLSNNTIQLGRGIALRSKHAVGVGFRRCPGGPGMAQR